MPQAYRQTYRPAPAPAVRVPRWMRSLWSWL